MLRTQDFSVAVGGALTLPIRAAYVKYLDGTAGGLSTRLRLRTELGGADITLEPGDSVRLPQEVAQFRIENADGEATISGTLIAGLGEFTSDRIIGTVRVIDSARDRTLAGVSFLGAVYAAGAAAVNARVQLWNPPGSGRRAIVKQMKIGSTANSPFNVYVATAAEANAYASPANPVNKLLGGAASVMEHRYDNIVALPAGAIVLSGNVIANDETQWYRFAEPVILPPGYGLLVRNVTVNQPITACFDFYEEVNS